MNVKEEECGGISYNSFKIKNGDKTLETGKAASVKNTRLLDETKVEMFVHKVEYYVCKKVNTVFQQKHLTSTINTVVEV